MLAFIYTYPCSPNDKEFMSSVYCEYERLMYATVRRYVSNRHICEDIVQDCVEKLIKKVATLRKMERCNLAAYIVSTVRNTAINYLRHQGRELNHYGGSVDDLEPWECLSAVKSLDEIVILKEKAKSIAKIWSLLSEEDRFLLEGKYMLENTDAELALQLGCKPDSIRMKLTRVRRKALALMTKMDGDIL